MIRDTDRNGQEYAEVKNIRVTRIDDANGSGRPGVSIRAKTGDGGRLHMGPEVQIVTDRDAGDVLAAIAWGVVGGR